LRRGFRILGVQRYSARGDVAHQDAVKLGRWSKIGVSTVKISDFPNSKPHFSTSPKPFGIAAAEQGSLAVVDLLIANSSKTRRFPDRAGQPEREDRFDLRLPPA